MDASAIQAKIYAGYAKAAKRVGYSFSIYRPTAALVNPLSGSPVGAVLATFTVTGVGFAFEKPSNYKNPLFNGMFDGRLTQPGDYLVSPDHGIYFIAAQADLVPPLCVQCNRVVSIAAPGPAKSFGAQDAYAGSTAANEQPALTLWPASILFDARGRATEVSLPMDLPSPFFSVLLPSTPAGTDIRSGMAIEDDQARRYLISASEHSGLGWRLSAQQAVT